VTKPTQKRCRQLKRSEHKKLKGQELALERGPGDERQALSQPMQLKPSEQTVQFVQARLRSNEPAKIPSM